MEQTELGLAIKTIATRMSTMQLEDGGALGQQLMGFAQKLGEKQSKPRPRAERMAEAAEQLMRANKQFSQISSEVEKARAKLKELEERTNSKADAAMKAEVLLEQIHGEGKKQPEPPPSFMAQLLKQSPEGLATEPTACGGSQGASGEEPS